MFEHALDSEEGGRLIRRAVEASLEAGVVTGDIDSTDPASTEEVGDWLAGWIEKS